MSVSFLRTIFPVQGSFVLSPNFGMYPDLLISLGLTLSKSQNKQGKLLSLLSRDIVQFYDAEKRNLAASITGPVSTKHGLRNADWV